MQINTEYEPETPLEKSALRALRTARWFSEGWRNLNIDVEGLRYAQIASTLERLDSSDLFQQQDETILDMLEKTLVTHLNEMSYGLFWVTAPIQATQVSLASVTSIPSLNLMPSMSLGN